MRGELFYLAALEEVIGQGFLIEKLYSNYYYFS